MIYADNAATTKLDIDALEAMKPYLMNEYGNASQPYSFSRTSKAALKEARNIIAGCINAKPEEIFFTSGGTESDNWAIKGTALYAGNNYTTITSSIEHHAVLRSCTTLEHLGYPVAYLGVNPEAIVLPSDLKNRITDRTSLVSIMLSNNEVGSIQPIDELCTIAHKYGALFHTDAVQAVGHIKIDVQALNVDMLSASAHKFNGPKGIGFLYIRKGTKIMPYLNGGAQESGQRAGTENIASIVGMAKALQKNCATLDENANKLKDLEYCLINFLNGAKLNFIQNGSDHRIPGNISLSFLNADGEMLLHRLDLMGICVSTGSACDSKRIRLSHVLEAMKVPKEYASGTIRISFSHSNTKAEAIEIAKALIRILNK